MNTRDTLDPDGALLIAEKALLAEDVLGSAVEVDWAYDGGKLWMLQAQPLCTPPAHFSPAWLPKEGERKTRWRRVSDQPISYFSRSLLWKPVDGKTKPGLFANPINGYVYRRVEDAGNFDRKQAAAARRLLERWQKKAATALRQRCSQVLETDLSGLDHARLLGALVDAADTVRRAASWEARMSSLDAAFTGELNATVTDASLCARLLEGLPDPTVLRDARLQELGERFRIANDNGKLGDEKWRHHYKREVEHFAREYGYSFAQVSELYDVASWKSWVEDDDAVFRIIGAVARQGSRPTLVTRHCAAQASADEAAGEAAALFKGGARRSLQSLLRLSRSILTNHNEAEQIYALACTGLRLALVEHAGRLHSSGVLAEKNDIFCLTLDELLALPAKPDKAARNSVATRIARRKHDLWLERRLSPPDVLLSDENTVDQPAADQPQELVKGRAAAPGAASGPARVVHTLEEAGEIERGDILIVKELSLAWTPFLSTAGALISQEEEFGSAHALQAREYGVPIVTGCHGILAAVKDRRKLTVDGFTGTVEITAFCSA